MAHLVERGAHHLRLAAQAVRVLHAVIAFLVRRADGTAFQQRAVAVRHVDLPRLAAQGILPAGMQAVPGKGVDLDGFGNIAGSTMNRVLSQLGARFDPLQNETDTSRARRQKREAKQRRGDYFAVKQKRGGLRPGIYQRVRTGFGSAVRSILAFVRPASYKPRYRIFDLAERMYPRLFAFHFENELRKAVETSKFRGRA